jgi:hypothetical protein
MKCLNASCQKEINKESKECSECNETFCSKTCLLQHNSLLHSINTNQENNRISSTNFTSSSLNNENPFLIIEKDSSSLLNNKFIKKGKVLEKYFEEPIDSLDNIEFVKNENNEFIKCGNGIFSEVYLGKNKKNNLNYAIKVIKKKKYS